MYDIPGNCGEPGRRSGLSVYFSEQLISYIPFQQLVEIPFYIMTTSNCMNYVDIMLMIYAACENEELTYQYGVSLNIATGDVEVDYNTTYGISNSTASFSVSWQSSPSLTAHTSSLVNEASSTSSSVILTWVIILFVLVLLLMVLMTIGFWKVFSILNKLPSATQQDKRLDEFYELKATENNESFQFSRERNENSTISSSKSCEPLLSRSPTTSIRFNTASSVSRNENQKSSRKVIILDSNNA